MTMTRTATRDVSTTSMAAVGGNRNEVRIINGHEVVFGTRSKYDAKPWECDCGAINMPERMLIFDIPAFKCHACLKEFTGDIDFCLANVKANGIPLLEACIAYAIAHMLEIILKIDSACNSDCPDIEESKICMNPSDIINPYLQKFSPSVSTSGAHRLLHMCQEIRDKGVVFENGEVYHVDEMRVIHCDDFEEVCRQIADGNPLLAAFHAGKAYFDLKYCQIYTAAPALELAIQRAKGVKTIGHMVLLIGAVSLGGQRGYYALDAAGNFFCPHFALDESWDVLNELVEWCTGVVPYGGFGKISASSDFFMNFCKFSRPGEDQAPNEKYDERFRLLNEDENAINISDENRSLLRGGDYFSERDHAVLLKLLELGLDCPRQADGDGEDPESSARVESSK